MAEVYDMKKIDGDVHNMHPQTCPAKMMIGMFTCCTMKIGARLSSAPPVQRSWDCGSRSAPSNSLRHGAAVLRRVHKQGDR